MLNVKEVKAKKQYVCNITRKVIEIGEIYQRLNSRNYGIFHFKKHIDKNKIIDFFMNNYVLENMYQDSPERLRLPAVWDQDHIDTMVDMGDEW